MASAKRWALMHEYREQPEFTMEELLARMSPVDLVLIGAGTLVLMAMVAGAVPALRAARRRPLPATVD